MMRSKGKPKEHSYKSAVRKKSPRSTSGTTCTLAARRARSLCLCMCSKLSSLVRTVGNWLVCRRRLRVYVHAHVSECVHVCVSLFVYTPASIWFQQGSLYNLHTVTRLMMAVLLGFVSYACLGVSLTSSSTAQPSTELSENRESPHLCLCGTSTHSR